MPVSRTSEWLQRGPTPGGFMVVGRLKPNTSLEVARAELETINRRLEASYPATNRGVIPWVATYSQIVSGPDAPMIWASLWVGAWLVLLIACANLANLTLLRTIGRWREFSTRIALGAGQGRMIRQILTECLMLASVAGALAWWITNWSVRWWAAATASRYQVLDYTVGAGTLGYLVAITVTAALLLSLAPIGKVLQLGVIGALKGDSRGVTQGLRGKHLAEGLVAAQMALAIVLLSGAGILVRSLVNIVGAETGVHDPTSILVGSTRLPSDKFSSPESRLSYFERLETRLQTIPGIAERSLASTIPVKSAGLRTFEIEGRISTADGEESVAVVRAGSGYFRVLGVSVISGRDFNDGDHASAPPVAIVNESFAAKFLPGEQPLGKRLRARDRSTNAEWRVVTGVVPNIMQGDPTRQNFKPLVYVPFRQEASTSSAYLLVRTSLPPAQVAQAVRSEVQAVDPDVHLANFTTLEASFAFDRDSMDAAHSELGKHVTVAPTFAAIAVVLAAIGLYAIIAHSIGQRTKEFAVRMAIGAAAEDIRWMVLRDGMAPVAVGVIAGLAASLGVNRLLQSQLVGVSPSDAVSMAGASLGLLLVALFACLNPARRAMNVAPAVALRHE